MSDASGPTTGELTTRERDRLGALAAAESLADLAALTGADEHGAYLTAKREWRRLCPDRPERPSETALPGEVVTVDGVDYHVHGVTHAGTEAERSHYRERVERLLADGDVYAEQGLRGLYFEDLGVCETDDYRWAVDQCAEAPADSFDEPFESERLEGVLDGLRDRVYGVIGDLGAVAGEGVERVLGDLASALLTGHEGRATGDGYEAFAVRRRVVEDPSRLPELQAYYRRSFLPQPVEREWLRRHDPDLEWVTHARNARIADYAVHHRGDAGTVHLVVGAAHGPGVAYYLREHRDGERSVEDFRLA